MNKHTIQELSEKKSGSVINGTFILTDKSLKSFIKKSGHYLQFNLGDKTGKLHCKVWDKASQINDTIKDNSVVQVAGQTSHYEGNVQAIIEHVEPCSIFDMKELAEFSKYNIDKMFTKLKSLIYVYIKETSLLKDCVDMFFNDESLMNDFKRCPGGVGSVHHAYFGGLLEHTLAVATNCHNIIHRYPDINIRHNNLLAGALFHDVGKIFAYDFKCVPKMSTRGRRLGHLSLGLIYFHDLIQKLSLTYSNKELLKVEEDIGHLILSHHGSYEFEACRLPMDMEATILTHADKLDADLTRIEGLLSNIEKGWTPFDPLTKRLYYKGND
jgi:3'-5' exoribonuclease